MQVGGVHRPGERRELRGPARVAEVAGRTTDGDLRLLQDRVGLDGHERPAVAPTVAAIRFMRRTQSGRVRRSAMGRSGIPTSSAGGG